MRRILDVRKLLAAHILQPAIPDIPNDENALDLSSVYPRMFVRRHDHTAGADLPGDDPARNSLAADVSNRTGQYAAAYRELRALTEVFRAYVAAVHITDKDGSICRELKGLPLLASEKVFNSLPSYHPTELFITLASYEFTDGRYRRLQSNIGSSLNGGIALRARPYLDHALRPGLKTRITELLNSQASEIRAQPTWSANGDQDFVAFIVRDPESSRAIRQPSPVLSAPPLRSDALSNIDSATADDAEIENAPPPATLPPRTRWFGR